MKPTYSFFYRLFLEREQAMRFFCFPLVIVSTTILRTRTSYALLLFPSFLEQEQPMRFLEREKAICFFCFKSVQILNIMQIFIFSYSHIWNFNTLLTKKKLKEHYGYTEVITFFLCIHTRIIGRFFII